jgi:hypothetical protein
MNVVDVTVVDAALLARSTDWNASLRNSAIASPCRTLPSVGGSGGSVVDVCDERWAMRNSTGAAGSTRSSKWMNVG